MTWDWANIAQLTGAAAPVVAGLATLRTPAQWKRDRDRLRQDAEILEKLPADSRARSAILDLIDAEAEALRRAGVVNRRDPSGAALGGVFLAIFAGLAVWAFSHGGAWQNVGGVVAAVVGSFFFYGFMESIQPAPRDAKGRRQRASE